LTLQIDDDAVRCAHCGDTVVHHDEVVIYECREDAREGMRVMVSGLDRQAADTGRALLPCVTVDASMVGNPSPRRQGVRVGLWCESCGERSDLTIVQHKGMTLVDCEKAPS